MRNAIRWSASLLTPAQRAVFAHLAVFAGGFDEAAAQAALAHDEGELRVLARVSLIAPAGEARRWRMLEPIRQFAEELLAGRGELRPAQARHAAYFAGLAEAARDALLGADAAVWMARLEAEHANLQAALAWAIGADAAEVALRIGQGIFRFWFRRGLWREGLNWLEQALALGSASKTPDDILTRAHYAAGVMAQTLNRFETAERHFAAGLERAFLAEDEERVAAIYCMFGILRKDQGRFDEALDFLDKSLEFQTERGMKFPWQSKADVLARLGRFDEAEAYYRKAMALNRKIEDEEGLAHTLRGLAEIAWRRGDPDTAEELLRQNEAICHKLQHARALSWTAQQFGNVARVRGQWRAAEKFYAAALAQLEGMGDRWGVCETLIECALLCAATRRFAAGAHLLGAAQAGMAAVGGHLTIYERGLFDECRNASAAALSKKEFAAAWAAGAQIWRDGRVADHAATLFARGG
jgi:tetratricopeptide (TPR) repeat protein